MNFLSHLSVSPNIGEKKVKSALKKILLKSKFLNIAELFSEGQQENFSVFTLDKLFDVFKSDWPDYSENKKKGSPSEYIIDMNVIYK